MELYRSESECLEKMVADETLLRPTKIKFYELHPP